MILTQNIYLPRAAWAAACAAWLIAATAAAGNSQIVVPGCGYSASDILGDDWVDMFCPLGDTMAIFSGSTGLEIVNPDNPASRVSWGKPDDYLDAYIDPGSGYSMVMGSFMTPDPSGESLWVGFTLVNNTDDRIYQVDANGWTLRATLTGNFDMEYFGGNAYVSANPGGMDGPLSTLYRLDTSGGNGHDALALVGGYSAGLGIDGAGNVYCGTYYLDGDDDGLGPDDNRMYRFSAGQIASAVGSDCLTLNDAEELFVLSSGADDVDVDDAGHVVFDVNNFLGGNRIAVWDEQRNGLISTIATPVDPESSWFGLMGVEGDVMKGGTIFATDYFQPGIAQIVHLVPGDADGDQRVDQGDLAVLAEHWGWRTDVAWSDGDFNGDGVVGAADAALLAANWGWGATESAGEAVPEPSVLVMMVGAAVWLLGARRPEALSMAD